jgi:hypothetical protein
MESRAIDSIVDSLVSGDLGADDFMRAVQRNIEAHETLSSEQAE